MTGMLQVSLFAGAIITMFYFLYKIRKNRIQIEYAISWSLFSALLVFLGAFPGVISWGANLIGIQSPANLLYLGIIFILILKQFTTTIKLSKMNRQITELAQHMALKEAERDCSENRQTRDVHDAE